MYSTQEDAAESIDKLAGPIPQLTILSQRMAMSYTWGLKGSQKLFNCAAGTFEQNNQILEHLCCAPFTGIQGYNVPKTSSTMLVSWSKEILKMFPLV